MLLINQQLLWTHGKRGLSDLQVDFFFLPDTKALTTSKMIILVYYLDCVFIVLAINSTGYDITLTVVIAEVWEHGSIRARETSSQIIIIPH